MYLDRFIVKHGGNPLGDDGGVGSVGVLPRPKNVEIAQSNRFHSIAPSEHLRVEFVDALGDRVRREAAPNSMLDLWQSRLVPIHRTTGSEDKSFDAAFAGGPEHRDAAVDVVIVGQLGVLQRTGNRSQGGLMQNVINTLHGLAARRGVPNIPLDPGESRPAPRPNALAHLRQIL